MELSAVCLVLVPSASALAGGIACLPIGQDERLAARLSVGSLAFALISALFAGVTGAERVGVYGAVWILLIALLVVGWAGRSMSGTSRHGAFLGAVCIATSASLSVLLTPDVRVMVVAWVVAGMCTSILLGWSTDRPMARVWAKRHALMEGIADVIWVWVLWGFWHEGGYFRFATLAHTAHGDLFNDAMCCGLLIIGAIRSALIPFHRWLPNSMEAPTPVSAFMHAGLVNGAGILLIKMAPLFAHSTLGLNLAVLIGGSTAIFGAVMVVARPEAKRRLGWSTVAQMGFLVLQCGCGGFAAALLHATAHGAYKASAFLGVGSAIRYVRDDRQLGAGQPSRLLGNAAAAYACAAATLGVLLGLGLSLGHLAQVPASSAVIALGWTMAVIAARRSTEVDLTAKVRRRAFVTIALGLGVYFAAVSGLDLWLGAELPNITAPLAPFVALIALTFGGIEGCGMRESLMKRFDLRDRFYVLALHEGIPSAFAERV